MQAIEKSWAFSGSRWKTLPILLILTPVMMSCGKPVKTELVCPPFPQPSTEVIDAIQGLNNQYVDYWMRDINTLRKNLELCQ